MRRSLISILCTAAVIGTLWFCSPIRTDLAATPVRVAAVQQLDMYNRVSAKGKVEQSLEKKIYSETSMRITQVTAELGDSVYKGQVLLRAQAVETSSQALPQLSDMWGAASLLGLDEESLEAILSGYSTQELSEAAGLSVYPSPAAEFSGSVASPIDGVVTAMNIKEGDIISAGQLCAAVSDLSRLQVRAQIPESSVSNIKVGMPVNIEGTGFGSRLYSGIVKKIMPTAVQASTLSGSASYVEAIVEIQNKDVSLKPGFSATLWIYTSKRSGALAVKYESIVQDNDNREAVYVLSGGRVYKRYIQTGFELDELVEVTLGLSPGEMVVLNPPDTLKNGERVTADETADGDA